MKATKLKRTVVVPIKRDGILWGFVDVEINAILKMDSQITEEAENKIVQDLVEKFKGLEDFVS